METPFNIIINNEIIAYCISVQENTNIYEINDVFVKEQYRGKGYGQELIKKVIKYYQENNNCMLKISTEITNIPAVNLYKKFFGNPYRSDSRYHYYCIYL